MEKQKLLLVYMYGKRSERKGKGKERVRKGKKKKGKERETKGKKLIDYSPFNYNQ